MKSEIRIIMSKEVARKWLEFRLQTEYRMQIYIGPREVKKLPNLLRSFRDGKLNLSGVLPLRDLGLEENFDSITVWSSDREAMISLSVWCENRGLETSGVW